MRFILTGGGTGGHVYPSLTVAQALRDQAPDAEMWYMGRSDGIEKSLAERAGLPYVGIASAPVRGARPVQLLANGLNILRGTSGAYRALGRVQADAIFATGGYVSVPVVVAGWLRRVPALVYLPDLEPGLAVKWLARIAKRVAVTFDEVERFFTASKVVVTGYPVRSEFARLTHEQARKRLDLSDGPVLLVLGGSSGAHTINMAVAAVLGRLLEVSELVHVCGPQDYALLDEQRQALPKDKQARYRLFDYLHEDMPAAMKAADLVICRAGASVLGELTVAGLPAILVPYPYAGEHQKKNAEYLSSRGAAVIVDNADLEKELLPVAQRLLSDEGSLSGMRENALRLGQPQAADRLASVLRSLARKKVARDAGEP